MVIKFTCEVAWRVKCALCDSFSVEHYKVHHGDDAPNPGLPPGWRTLDGYPICDKHQIDILDTGASAYRPVTVEQLYLGSRD